MNTTNKFLVFFVSLACLDRLTGAFHGSSVNVFQVAFLALDLLILAALLGKAKITGMFASAALLTITMAAAIVFPGLLLLSGERMEGVFFDLVLALLRIILYFWAFVAIRRLQISARRMG